MRTYVFLFILSFCVNGIGQIGGRYAYKFLDLVSVPNQAALGGVLVTGIPDQVATVLLNPAVGHLDMQQKLAVSYVNFVDGIHHGSAAYAFTVSPKKQLVHVGVNFAHYGKFSGYDVVGNPTQDFQAQDIAVLVGSGFEIPKLRLRFGFATKWISSKLEQYGSFGMAVDLGLYHQILEKKIDLALVCSNLGIQLTNYHAISEPLPFSITLGFSKTLEGVPIRWHVSLQNLQQWNIAFRNPSRDLTDLQGNITADNPSFINNILRHIVLGVSLFPNHKFSCALGYNFRRAEELRILEQRAFAGLSGGITIRLAKLKFQYAYARYHTAVSTNTIGLQLDLSSIYEK